MQQPNYTDNQFVNGALLNQGQSYIAASLKDLGASLFTAGLFYPNDLTYTLNSLSVSVSAGTSFRLLDGEGNLCGFYGTTNGQTSSSVTVDFSSLVPASGSVTAYLVATRYALSQNSTAVIGPPIGHPDYNPSNALFLWYTETEDSLHVYATTTAPDNATVFELLRTTLTAGQTSITSYSTANARYAQPNQSVIVYAGNPNGNLAGVQGGNGVTPSIVWDTSDNLFWVCTTTGSDSTAVWIDAAGYLQIEAVIKGAGLTPDRTNTAQLLAALQILFPPYSGVKQVAPAIANATVINTSGATTTATVTFTAPANGWVIGFATTHLAAAGNSTGYQFSLLINGTTINQDTNPNTNTEYGFLSVTAGESCTVTGQLYLSGGVLSANANIQTFAFFIPNP